MTFSDADMLWKLHLWCADTRRQWKAWAVLQKVIRVDRDHAKARAALGHEASGDYWFTMAEARQRFETSQDPEVAAARGYVLQNDLWMHPGERSLASKGRVKDQESGLWLSAADRKRLADGWVRQDFEWIEPAEVDQADNWKWRVDGEWLDLRGANERHARIDSMWQLPGVDVTVHASVDRETALLARYHMTRALDDLRKVSFMVDGGCAPVAAEHEKLKSSLRAGRSHAKHIKALEEVLLAHEEELRAFAAL